MNISVIGLGKLGLCTAACFASAGHTVYGFDRNDYFRSELEARRNPIEETGLTEILESAWETLHIADSYEAALHDSDITLIIVPTPSLPDGRFTNDYLVKVLEGLAPALKSKNSFHIVNVVSTVMPGSCDNIFKPLLEQATGKSCGTEFGLVYNPEFIALGSVIRNFLNPDMVLIGASDERSGSAVRELYSSTCKTSPTMAVMSLVNAEITKISLNCYVTMKISYANGLAAICEQVPGADVDVITAAIGADSRVGNKCLKGGLGFGGPCFPRDNIAFQVFAEEFGVEALLGKAVVAVNNSIPKRLFNRISEQCAPPAKVALLGLSYKADTHIIEESHSMVLAKSLVAAGYQVSLHDPTALDGARGLLGNDVVCCADPYECLTGAAAIALLTDWPQYRDLNWERIAMLAAPGALVLDSWRTAMSNDMSAFTYIPVGVGISAKDTYL
ncbi:MAG: nucleotide sugar dehydrogenase [Geobacter sp.]|nr:nucleotide sugar dehydrogenase [Geobacter sp.]